MMMLMMEEEEDNEDIFRNSARACEKTDCFVSYY